MQTLAKLRWLSLLLVGVSGCYYDDFELESLSEETGDDSGAACEAQAVVDVQPAVCGEQALVNSGLEQVACGDTSDVEAIGWGSHTPITSYHVMNDLYGWAHTGSWYAYLGGYYGPSDSFWQSIQFPENFAGATLTFYVMVVPRQTPKEEPLDYLYVDLIDEQGYIRVRLHSMSDLDYVEDESATSGYAYQRIDVDIPAGGLEGMLMKLRFSIVEDFQNGVLDFSDYYVDDVTLTLNPC